MYNNIGEKIKGLANIIGYGGMFIFILVGIALFLGFNADPAFEDLAFIPPIVSFIGCILSWLSGFFIYGFGELIDQTKEINQKLFKVANEKNEKETD